MQMHEITQAKDAEHGVLSKVIVVEHDPKILADIKAFFEACNLVGYRVNHDNAPAILGTTIDLGAIFLAEADSDGHDCFELLKTIHGVRPDLPIFMRLLPGHTLNDLPSDITKYLAGAFPYGDFSNAKALIETFLFSRHYPSEFVSEMKAMSLAALQASPTPPCRAPVRISPATTMIPVLIRVSQATRDS